MSKIEHGDLNNEAALPQQADVPQKSAYVPRRGFRYFCYRFIKRCFDLITSTLFILIFSWLYIILAIVVKCSDGGSVFYKHPRVGKNGKTIYIRKFRRNLTKGR